MDAATILLMLLVIDGTAAVLSATAPILVAGLVWYIASGRVVSWRWATCTLLIWLVASFAASYLTLRFCEWQWYLGKLPAAIETSYPILIDAESDFREGCGVAIFRLSARTRADIETGGLPFFDDAIESRAADKSYERWRSTPAVGSSLEHSELANIVIGLGCADAPRGLQEQIFRSMQTPGSYYTLTHEAALLVIPAQRLVVFGYFG